MKSSSDGFRIKLTMFERNTQEASLRLWDNIHDLQELSNVTSRNLEEIYDKDIIKLQHFQNVAEEQLKRLKSDIDNMLQNGAVSHRTNYNDDKFEEKFYQVQDAIQMIRNQNKINQNLFQGYRNDLNRAFVDVDDLKKFRQQTTTEIELFKRFMGNVQVSFLFSLL